MEVKSLKELMQVNCQKPLEKCNDEEIYHGLVKTVMEISSGLEKADSKKKLYYISAEFLIGKLLINNLINLGIYDEAKELLQSIGKDINEIENCEKEPSLGNGGLGRLASCFLDSVATLNLCGDGLGLYYHFGLFKQAFENLKQCEYPNEWKSGNNFLRKRDITYQVDFKDFSLKSRMYDIDIIGYGGKINNLHLFDLESIDEDIVTEGIDFDKTDIRKNLTLFLYPDDSDDRGKLLRLYQQYFMASSSAQLIIDECVEKGCNLHDLNEYAVIQINDTHPSLIIPELIKILCDRGLNIDTAINVVTKCCAYTNHTILSEALEKWPVNFIEKINPDIMKIIKYIDNKVKGKYKDTSLHIIENGLVHMARMDIHICFSVNGVASLHTEILRNVELNNFYRIYPNKFNNKTNGITFRRWLLKANQNLSDFLTSLIGDDYKKDANNLKKLLDYIDDADVLNELIQIKEKNKNNLKKYMFDTQNRIIDTNSIFDMQIKRLHEYKRQQLNVLYLIDKYLEIKGGKIPKTPITAIFGAKSAPSYTIAKDIIHLILCMERLVKNDESVCKHLNIVMVENYNVTWAERLIPACDISQQISLASKEASGTGNMKLMLNGAITLGTMDGANVEINNLVGQNNIYIFGSSSDEVIERYKSGNYRPYDYVNQNDDLKRSVNFIASEEMLSVGDKVMLQRLQAELLNKDWFMTFPDFKSYKETRNRAYDDYGNKHLWAKKMLVNIANAGYFSSDRTITQYNNEIWNL